VARSGRLAAAPENLSEVGSTARRTRQRPLCISHKGRFSFLYGPTVGACFRHTYI